MDRRDLALLLESADDLGDTFARNRLLKQRENEFNLTRADRTRETDLDRAMREKEFGLRRDDAADARDIRRQALDETTRHHGAIEGYQKQLAAAKSEDEKWQILVQMGKEGMLTQDGIDRMSQEMAKKFGELGVGVKLFKLPSAEGGAPQFYSDPETGDRFATRGNTMMRSHRPMADVTEEEDPITGDMKRKVTRQVPVTELDKAMERRGVDDETAGPNPKQQREIDSILATPGIPASGPPSVKQPPAPIQVNAVPRDPAQRKVGMIYQTPKGPLKWTGTGWVKP